jgi:hypothetical protein
MLTEDVQKQIANLLAIGDQNVQVTVVAKYTGRLIDVLSYDELWKKAFKNSLGDDIINDAHNIYRFNCTTVKGCKPFATVGTRIIYECWKYIKDEDVVRIDIIRAPGITDQAKSWIVVRNEYKKNDDSKINKK